MEDYAANSHLSKRKAETKEAVPEKKVEKVVTGNVKMKKKTGLSAFVGSVFQEDAQSVKRYIFADVLLPALKKAIDDVVSNGIRMLLYGDSASKSSSNGLSSRISYNRMYGNQQSYQTENRFSMELVDQPIFDNRGDAELVLTQMDEILSVYKVVTLGDFYDLLGITAPFTANKYGWTNLRSASVVSARGGWVIKLPKALPID